MNVELKIVDGKIADIHQDGHGCSISMSSASVMTEVLIGHTVEEAKALITGDKEEYTIPIKRNKAEITINDLGKEAFPELIEDFSTRYDASYWSRSENLKKSWDGV